MSRGRYFKLLWGLLCFFIVGFCHDSRAETIQSGIIMAHTACQTSYVVKKGDEPGPVIVVIGGLHGNEPAGYLAARRVAKWTVTKGTLVVLSDAHMQAIRRNVRAYPGNMNNMFPGKSDGDQMQRLAFEIFGLIKRSKPDLLLTLHESIEFHSQNPKRYGQTLCYDFPELTPMMQQVLDRVNPQIAASRDKISVFVEPHPTCPTYQTWHVLHAPATSIETCRELPLNQRINYQLLTIEGFCDKMGLGYEQKDVPQLPEVNAIPQAMIPGQQPMPHAPSLKRVVPFRHTDVSSPNVLMRHLRKRRQSHGANNSSSNIIVTDPPESNAQSKSSFWGPFVFAAGATLVGIVIGLGVSNSFRRGKRRPSRKTRN